MQSYLVCLRTSNDAVQFVHIVNKYDEDVDLKRGSILVDAKSVLGAMPLVGGGPLEVIVHSDRCDSFRRDIENYICA